MPYIGGRPPMGSEDKFKHLVAELKSRGGVKNPYAVATAQSKKYAEKRGWSK